MTRRTPLYVGGIAMALAGIAVLRLPKDVRAEARELEGAPGDKAPRLVRE